MNLYNILIEKIIPVFISNTDIEKYMPVFNYIYVALISFIVCYLFLIIPFKIFKRIARVKEWGGRF